MCTLFTLSCVTCTLCGHQAHTQQHSWVRTWSGYDWSAIDEPLRTNHIYYTNFCKCYFSNCFMKSLPFKHDQSDSHILANRGDNGPFFFGGLVCIQPRPSKTGHVYNLQTSYSRPNRLVRLRAPYLWQVWETGDSLQGIPIWEHIQWKRVCSKWERKEWGFWNKSFFKKRKHDNPLERACLWHVWAKCQCCMHAPTC